MLLGRSSERVGGLQHRPRCGGLTENGKTYEFHRYDDAGHALFSPDRPSYRVAAANDGWERIEEFYNKYLGG
jgi:carboxymethylenebutenolidase